MLHKLFILLFISLAVSAYSYAQDDNLPVSVHLTKENNNDSLWVTVTINTNPKPGSLMFIASPGNSTSIDTFFLPVIDSSSLFCFVLPPGYKDDLLLRAYYAPGIFRIAGTVNTKKTQVPVKAILITSNQQFYNKELVLKDNNRFSLPPMVFQGKASLAFNYNYPDKKRRDHPDIVLDNTIASLHFDQQVFSQKLTGLSSQNKNGPTQQDKRPGTTNPSDSNYKTLNEVKISGVKKTPIEKFNDETSSGFFKDINEKTIDCLTNDNILSFPDCISYLQSQVAGITTATEKFGNTAIKWRGHQMKAFFIDEIPVDIDQVLGMNTADIAMIKVYAPPFFGAGGNGDGGALAIYTRRGEYRRADTNAHQWLFTVRGYASPVHMLLIKK
jgi:hypothetical protein